MQAKDITIGTRVVFDGQSTVWTVVGKRRLKGGTYTLRLAFESEGVVGKATTRPLDPEYEIETRP